MAPCRIAGGLCTAGVRGSAGQNAVRQIEPSAPEGLQPVCEPLIVCTHAQTPEAILAAKTIGAEDLRRCEEIGAAIAAGMAMGIF